MRYFFKCRVCGEAWEDYLPIKHCGICGNPEPVEAVPVVFRVLTHTPYQKGEAIALFPTLVERNGLVQSYMHVGQHGSADYAGMIRESRKATPSEYAPLMRELQGAPYHYNLIVYDRKPRT